VQFFKLWRYLVSKEKAMKVLFPAIRKYIVLLLAISVIGCGSGGLTDAPSSSTPTPTPTPTPPVVSTTVTGTVVDGFVVGATVRACKVNADGARGDAIGSATTTDASGNYSLNLGDYTGPVLIESTGGTYKDWVTGVNVSVTSPLPLSALVSNASGAVKVNVTPLTHMASLRARQDIRVNKSDVATAIDSANTKIGEYFKILDIITNVPIDPTVANSGVGVSQTRIDYAMVLGGISQRASTGGMDPFSLVDALSRDAEDGVFDGKQNGVQLTVAKANGVGAANLDAADAKAALSANINTFQRSTANVSGGNVTSSILTSLSDPANTGTISAKPDIPTGFTVTVVSSTQINLAWTASTGAAWYNIYKGGASLKSVTMISTSDTGLTADKSYCYRITACDASGNESAQSNQLCATTYALPPADPTSLLVRAVSPTQIDLSWTAPAGALQYKIYRDEAFLAVTASTYYTDSTVAANKLYAYRITAIGTTGSESSGQTSTSTAHTGLTIPSSITATVDSSTQISLSWVNSGGVLVTGYKIYKNGEPYVAVGSAAITALVDDGLLPNTTHCYCISATDSSGNESFQSANVCGTTQSPPMPNSIDLLVGSPQISSDGSAPVVITAMVKDSQNRAMSGQTVEFSADSGILTDLKAVTDINGVATANLGTGGDPTSRTIAVQATTGGRNAANEVAVTGTSISIDPPDFSLPFNDPAGRQLTISLKNSAGMAIKGKTVSLSSGTGKSVFTPASPYVTDNSGQVKVTLKNGEDTVSDTITASSTGVSSQATLTINNAKLTVNAPAADAEFLINMPHPFIITYTENGAPVVGKVVYFTATRGTLSQSNDNTDSSGQVTVNVTSVNAGPAVLTAYTTGGTQASVQTAITFISSSAAKVDVSAFPAVIGTNPSGQTGEQSVIKAIVRDANDNLVKGKTVNFRIVQDASSGTLAKGSAVTDIYGTATTNYIAGGVTSGLNNVQIEAKVNDTPSVYKTTTLTVGGQALFISLATGPEVSKVAPSMYRKDYLALVTDAGGIPVPNAVVTATVTPQYYMKGYYYICGDFWCQRRTLIAANSTYKIVPACANEDGFTHNTLYDYNGILDLGEDQNSNSRLDPGNVVSVTSTVTDSSGHSTVSLTYAMDYATWVNVKLEVLARLSGSTSGAVQTFILTGAAEDYADIKVSPPGNPSPFGSNTTCYPSLTAMTLSDTQISINWDLSAYADSYNIYRDPNNNVSVMIASNVKTTAYDDPVVAGNTYCYQIKQVDSAGVETYLSDRVCVSSGAKTPTGVSATAISSTQIQVAWGDAGAASYRIYKDGARLEESVTRSIVSGSLTPNTQHCYGISSFDASGNESEISSTVCATTQLAAPPVPTGLAAAGGVLSVNLSWNASVGAAFYRIYRNGSLVISATGLTAVDAAVIAQTDYCYTISAVDASGNESGQSTPSCTATP
jgi:fibronectin type 3 domain-containing protein